MFSTFLQEAIPDPFALTDVGIVIPHPSDEAVRLLDHASNLYQEMQCLCGPSFGQVWQLCQTQRATVVRALAAAIREYYNLATPPPTGWSGLVELMSRFGGDIEYDLQDELALDLVDWFRGVHSWHKLYRLLPRLPAEGRYKAALAMDADYAEKLARLEADGLVEAPSDDEEVDMSPLRYGPVEQRLDAVIDMLQYLRVTVHASAGGDPHPVTPVSRPMTALARARQKIAMEELQVAADQFMELFVTNE